MGKNIRFNIDTDLDPDTNVHLNDVTSIMFNQCIVGIYYYYMTNTKNNIIKSQVTNYTFLDILEIKKAYLRQSEIKGVEKVRILQ